MQDNIQFRVVINHEEQYMIWPARDELPRGFKATDGRGTLEQCFNYYIEEVWTDMRPISLSMVRR